MARDPDKKETKSAIPEIFGYALTLATTVLAAWVSIGMRFYKNLSSYGVFNDLQVTRDQQAAELFKNTKNGNFAELLKGNLQIESDYTKAVDERLKEWGVDSIGKKWQMLKSHQQKEVILSTITVLAISLGAIIGIARSRSKKQQELLERVNEQQQQMQHSR